MTGRSSRKDSTTITTFVTRRPRLRGRAFGGHAFAALAGGLVHAAHGDENRDPRFFLYGAFDDGRVRATLREGMGNLYVAGSETPAPITHGVSGS